MNLTSKLHTGDRVYYRTLSGRVSGTILKYLLSKYGGDVYLVKVDKKYRERLAEVNSKDIIRTYEKQA